MIYVRLFCLSLACAILATGCRGSSDVAVDSADADVASAPLNADEVSPEKAPQAVFERQNGVIEPQNGKTLTPGEIAKQAVLDEDYDRIARPVRGAIEYFGQSIAFCNRLEGLELEDVRAALDTYPDPRFRPGGSVEPDVAEGLTILMLCQGIYNYQEKMALTAYRLLNYLDARVVTEEVGENDLRWRSVALTILYLHTSNDFDKTSAIVRIYSFESMNDVELDANIPRRDPIERRLKYGGHRDVERDWTQTDD